MSRSRISRRSTNVKGGPSGRSLTSEGSVQLCMLDPATSASSAARRPVAAALRQPHVGQTNQYDQSSVFTQFRRVTSVDATLTCPHSKQSAMSVVVELVWSMIASHGIRANALSAWVPTYLAPDLP